MNIFYSAKKFVQTFSFKQKKKLLNSLLYASDDMLEDPEVYQQLFDIINSEEKVGEHNPSNDSIINQILKNHAIEATGSVNYVFKLLWTMVRCVENTGILFAQSFLDCHPIAAIEDDKDVYKMDFRRTVADAAIHIFAIQCKVIWIESNQDFEDNVYTKTSKWVTLTGHFSKILEQSYHLIPMIKEVEECEDLQNDQPFMYLFDYSLKMSVVAYKALVTYSSMICEFDKEYEISYEQTSKTLDSLEAIKGIINDYHTTICMYQYMVEDAGSIADNTDQYSHKRIPESIKYLDEILLDKQPQYSPRIEEEENKHNVTDINQMETQINDHEMRA